MSSITGIWVKRPNNFDYEKIKSLQNKMDLVKVSDTLWLDCKSYKDNKLELINRFPLLIVFDGYLLNKNEILNQLKENIDTKATFATIIHASYIKWGFSAFNKLNGAFVIMIWDEKKDELILVRDRFGIKPIYYYNDDILFVFSQNVKKIIEFGIKPIADQDTFGEYLLFRYVTGKRTFFKNIQKLPRGHFLFVNENGIKQKEYYNYLTTSIVHLKENVAIEKLFFLIKKSLQNILSLTHNPNILQSRGVDSSLITACLRNLSIENINTYTIKFLEKEYDESQKARFVASKFNTHHHEIIIKSTQYAQALPQLISLWGQPLEYPGAVSLYIAFKSISRQTKAILSGEVADAIFAGYPCYFLINLTNLNPIIKFLAAKFISIIPTFFLGSRLKHKKMKLMAPFVNNPEDYILLSTSYSSLEEVKKLLKTFTNLWREERERFLEESKALPLQQRLLYYREKTHTFPEIVQDVPSIYWPFANNEILEFVNSLPMNLKIKGITTKYIEKKLAERFLPKNFIYKPKSGFGTPLEYWFRDKNSLGKYLQMLEEERTLDRGIFNPDELIKIVHQFKHGKRPPEDYDGLLWTIVNLELWHRIFIDQDYEFKYR